MHSLEDNRAELVERAVTESSFTPLGWFAVADGDDVPDDPNETPARTVLLVGNAGPTMWQRFSAERDPAKDTLDAWSEEVLSALAGKLDARAFFPFDKPPLPVQRWAARAGTVHTSPLGMSIHGDYGLWHAYRAAFAFGDEIPFAPAGSPASPCDTCEDKPCLQTCPVGAFSGSGYDVPACAAHITRPEGTDCVDLGCRARRACPVGREYVYEPAQARFHMTAFVRARSGE